MGWFIELCKAYEGAVKLEDAPPPIGFEDREVHIAVTISSCGDFIRAELMGRKEKIAIPITEESAAGRTSGIVPHPFMDTLEYVAESAGDYIASDKFKRRDSSAEAQKKFSAYEKKLSEWCASQYTHPTLLSVLTYIRKGTLIKDLLNEKILHLGSSSKFSKKSDYKEAPEIFKRVLSQEKAMICWVVEGKKTWLEKGLQEAWSKRLLSLWSKADFCYVLGEELPAAKLHTKNIASTANNAKLISSNDNDGYTYRGRFLRADEAAVISAEASAKAHAALKWLIKRQGYQNSGQIYVAWATALKEVPDIFNTPLAIDDDDFSERDSVEPEQTPAKKNTVNLGFRAAEKIRNMIAGHKEKLYVTDNIMLLGLDSPTEGRLSVTYFREFGQEDFFNTLEQWYLQATWYRWFADRKRPLIGTFTPYEISTIVYGKTRDGKVRKEIVKRLLPCIAEGRDIPADIVDAAVSKASNPHSLRWENVLAVACALYRCNSAREKRVFYSLELDNSYKSRDYLFGRLLAVAENIERFVLGEAGNTKRFMLRFSIEPFNTWQELFEKMIPYMKRLFSMGASNFYYSRMAILQEIHASFVPAEFKDNSRLSGEFLLGYDLQRQALYQKYTAEKGGASPDALNRSRDYLFGRLLAVAAKIEESTMNEDEKRFTNAESAVPQFSLQPLTVWKAVFEKTLPYGERLIMHGNRGLYTKLTELLEEIHNLFKPKDFNNERLSGEYILGYFAQRNAMNEKISNDPQNVDIEENNRSRDYLYGRLLAVARAVEETVLSIKGRLYSTEDRPTNAERYQRAFSVKPNSTWKHISMKVGVHEPFLKTHLSEHFYEKMRTETETIENAFQPGDFEKEECLSGEYLLGYFKQLRKLAPANKYSKQGENYESKPQN